MFVYNPDLKRAYFGKGKTGTTTVYSNLGLSVNSSEQTADGWINASQESYINFALKPEFNDYHITCLVRDPYSRWISGIIEVMSDQFYKVGLAPEGMFSSSEKFRQMFDSVIDLTYMGKDFSMNQNFHTAPFMWEVYLLLYTRNTDILLTENIDNHFDAAWNKQSVHAHKTINSNKNIADKAIKGHGYYPDIIEYLKFDTSLYYLLEDHSSINDDYTLNIANNILQHSKQVENQFFHSSSMSSILSKEMICALYKALTTK